MDTPDFSTSDMLPINGNSDAMVPNQYPLNGQEEELSENEADGPSLKFVGNVLNNTLHKLNPLRHISTSSNNSIPSLDLTLNEQFTDDEVYNLVLRLQNLSSETIYKTLITLADDGFDLNSGAVDTNNTLLHTACSAPMGHKILIEMLKPEIVRLGINVNSENIHLELPIHLAIKYDHATCVQLLLDHDKSLLYVIDQDGFGIVHKASKYLAFGSIQVIVSYDPNSINTYPRNDAFKDASVIHIAIGSYRLKRSQEAQSNQDNAASKQNVSIIFDIKDTEKIYNITSFFLERCSPNIMVRNGRSLIHQMIEIEDIQGLKIVFRKFQKERKFIHDFVNRPHHDTGRSALMTTIEKSYIDIAMLLLENGADPNARIETRLDNRGQTVSERAIQLSSDPKEVAELLGLLIKHGADVLPALEAVIDVADMTLARAVFDELPDPEKYINHEDSTSGETILYSCLASFRLGDTEKQEIENIVYLLEKGANVMITKQLLTPHNSDDTDSERSGSLSIDHYSEVDRLPIHIAVKIETDKKLYHANYWGKNRARNYISALKAFGLQQIFKDIKLPPVRYTFLREHILPAAYLVDHEAVHEFLSLLFSLDVPKIQTEIVHYSAPSSSYEMYQYPILHWATLYNHPPLMNSVVRAEYKVHEEDKDYGFHCFRKLENNALKQQAIEAYNDMFHKTPQWLNQLISTIGEVIIMLYLLFSLDIFFDIDIVRTYYCLSANSTTPQECEGNLADFDITAQEDTCLSIREESDPNRSRYQVAAKLSIALTIPSILAFLFMSYFHFTIPQKLLLTEYGDLNPTLAMQLWKGILWVFKPIIFLVVHFIRALRSKAMPYDSLFKQKYDEGRIAWNLIRRVEIGIESTGQLIVQLYVLAPLALQFSGCNKMEIVKHIRNGLGYYASLTTLDATFEERMMSKFLMSSVHICVSITIMRLSKNSANGLGSMEAMFCFFLSCLCQLTLRCMDLTLLFISGVHPNDVFWILVGHWILTFCLKLIFEVMIKKKRKSPIKSVRSVIAYLFNLLTTTLCSSIVYVPMVKSDQTNSEKDPNADNTFLSTLAYFVLTMIEHIILIGTTWNRAKEVGEAFKNILYVFPIVLWFLALVLLLIYYKFLHRSTTTGLIGPRFMDNNLVNFHAVVCCDVKHCSINFCSCIYSFEDVDYCDSKCPQRQKQSLDFNLNALRGDTFKTL